MPDPEQDGQVRMPDPLQVVHVTSPVMAQPPQVSPCPFPPQTPQATEVHDMERPDPGLQPTTLPVELST
jgi:hypothetical protein